MTPPRELWERQPGESARAYSHFTHYRDMGPTRSLRKLEAAKVLSRTQLGRKSAQNEWPKRAQAWDDYLDQTARLEAEKAWVSMKVRHAKAGADLVDLGLKELGRLRKKLTEAQGVKGKSITLDPREIALVLEVGAKLERMTLSEDAGKDAGAERAASGGLAVVLLPAESKDAREWERDAKRKVKPAKPAAG